MNDSFWLRIIYIVTTVISLAVAFLILGPRPDGLEGMLDVSALPMVNATLNSITTLLLIVALVLIKQKKIDAHKKVMLSAFGTSALFLATYVIYHWFKAGPKLYIGEWITFYYSILLSHIILAIILMPLALIALYRGWNNQITKHRKIVKFAYPVWLYVSITGVTIYGMLYL
jgi:putative membrane protein